MKIAITSQNRRTVSGHAGKCTRFYIFDINKEKEIVSKELFELDPEMMLHNHFHGPNPEGDHPLFAMNVIITGDMGAGFPIKMKSKGIQAIMTDVVEVDEVIEKALAGTLEMLPPKAHAHKH
jgi:predicted Fe-Mo cluster-binding NifX family protein